MLSLRQTLIPESTEGTMYLWSLSPIQLSLITLISDHWSHYYSYRRPIWVPWKTFNCRVIITTLRVGRQGWILLSKLGATISDPPTAKYFPPRSSVVTARMYRCDWGMPILEVIFKCHNQWCCPFQSVLSDCCRKLPHWFLIHLLSSQPIN